MTRHSFVDLFAGCGGLSLGLSMAGFRGRFAIERDPMAFRTFAANFIGRKGAPVPQFAWPSWLKKQAWGIEDLLSKHRSQLEALRGQVELLAGGPPCQGFSFAGRRNKEDPRNLLFKRYVEVVSAIRPKILILENVPGMRVGHVQRNIIELPIKGAASRAKSFYDRVADKLDSIGYEVEAHLIDASRFGVPQRRSRLIAIGIRKDLLEWLEDGVERVFVLLEECRSEQLRELGLPARVSASAALSDLEINRLELVQCTDPDSPNGFQEARHRGPRTIFQRLMHAGHRTPMDSMRLARHCEEVQTRFAQIIAECRQGVRMNDISRGKYGLKKHRIFPMARKDPAPTITTLPDDVLHYSEPRILTVRECARLQSFPDWFIFKGKFTTGGHRRTKECPRYTQVGNAVPPYLARAIGLAIKRVLKEITTNQRRSSTQEQETQIARRA